MKKFIVIYHTPAAAMESMGEMSPEDMQKGMEPWMTWAAKCGSQLTDMGSPLMGGKKLAADGTSTASEKEVTGYSILEAESMEAAIALMDGHPHLGWNAGCEIEIHESAPLPM